MKKYSIELDWFQALELKYALANEIKEKEIFAQKCKKIYKMYNAYQATKEDINKLVKIYLVCCKIVKS